MHETRHIFRTVIGDVDPCAPASLPIRWMFESDEFGLKNTGLDRSWEVVTLGDEARDKPAHSLRGNKVTSILRPRTRRKPGTYKKYLILGLVQDDSTAVE